MGLPRLIVVTDRGQAGDLVAVVGAGVEAGATTVLFREKDLPWDSRLALGRELVATGAQLLLATDDPATDASLAYELGAVGLHLSARAGSRRFAGVVGRSCHSVDGLRRAMEEGAGYATLSPIWVTESKPGYGPALGLEALAATPLPTYALGGVTPGRAGEAVDAGAAGVAVMGAVMTSPDPGGVVRLLRAELGETVEA